jgi:hypothetical protein
MHITPNPDAGPGGGPGGLATPDAPEAEEE